MEKNNFVIFVQDWILPGGALKVFENLIQKTNFSNAEIWTIYTDRDFLNINGKKIFIKTALPAWLNKLFLRASKKKIFLISFFLDYRNLMFFFPFLMKILSWGIIKKNPDKVVISSFSIAKNLSLGKLKNTKKIVYFHSPFQYGWNLYEEYLKNLNFVKKIFFIPTVWRLKKRDKKKKFTNFDEIYCNSQYTKNNLKKIYGIEAQILYPPVDQDFQNFEIIKQKRKNYFVYLGRITKLYKKVDLIIKAFEILANKGEKGINLLVIGNGPDKEKFQKIAPDNVIFVNRIKDNQEKIEILSNSLGLIHISPETFGIATLEALITGTPVIGLNGGATPELICQDCGILIDPENLTAENLAKEIKNLLSKNRDYQKIHLHAKKIIEKINSQWESLKL